MEYRRDEMDGLAHRVAELGPDAVGPELAELAWLAAIEGVEPFLLAVMCDPREPEVVRQRAFARVAAEWAARLDAADRGGRDGAPARLSVP
ncbi:hypothetical protein [Phytoactinopolyspora mesophila]|uniref:Uncharacterized protein n=1 Tax=Phytoactinopolyspora mesophila TaxID=2650750 RepID=A0A7K3MBA2_9ACTN|nr:hypothetical protein [Phytoactinopolyspora mesophila]NDL60573.1 hypothetical protein [Phytoactinopolyspora mesophila]